MFAAGAPLRVVGPDDAPRPGAAESLREGLADTLTVNRLGIDGKLRQTVESTNPVESMIEIVAWHARRVKRWRDGEMALRWAAAGMHAAQAQFRRVKGYRELPDLARALEAAVADEPGPLEFHHQIAASANMHPAPATAAQVQRRRGHPPVAGTPPGRPGR